MMHNYYGQVDRFLGMANMGWISIVMMIVHILVWVAIIFFAVKLIKKLVSRSNSQVSAEPLTAAEDGALRILRERYAKGEIDFDEYNQRKTGLQ